VLDGKIPAGGLPGCASGHLTAVSFLTHRRGLCAYNLASHTGAWSAWRQEGVRPWRVRPSLGSKNGHCVALRLHPASGIRIPHTSLRRRVRGAAGGDAPIGHASPLLLGSGLCATAAR
jgi:hypothetical protein